MGIRPKPTRPLQQAERDALADLVRCIGPRLLAYVRRAYPTAEAEDVVAETFFRAAQNMMTLQHTERQDFYLLTIARNLCRDGARRRRGTMQRGLESDGYAATDPPPDAQLDGHDRHLALLQAIDGLPDAQREVVVLRLSAGLTFERIAELLGIPLGTALARMRAATQRLSNKMGCIHDD